MTNEEIAHRAAQAMLEKKAHDIVLLDLRRLTDVTDFFVICSCDNDRQVKSVAENVKEKLSELDLTPWKTEGWDAKRWVILDYIDVVVHVFYRETRHFYKLERLWADASIEHVGNGEKQSTETLSADENNDSTE